MAAVVKPQIVAGPEISPLTVLTDNVRAAPVPQLLTP